MSSQGPKMKSPMNLSEFMYKGAKKAGNKADIAQMSFRSEHAKHTKAVSENNTSARKAAAKGMLKNALQIVLHRNRELKKLGGFVASADVNTGRDRTFFWSGDEVDSSKKIIHSAMTTAQDMAKKISGSTVEMTPGVHMLDNYAGHSNSFGYLKERFQYTTSKDRNASQKLREELITKGIKSTGQNTRDMIGHKLFDDLSLVDKQGQKSGPLARPGSAAGALWDVISVRFAKQASGIVNVIHAAPSSDPYFSSNIFRKSTWITKEMPTLIAQGRTQIIEKFGENLKGHLKGPTNLINWENTGGFRGNLKPRSKL